LEVPKLIDATNPGRDGLMLEVAYLGGLRVFELVSLTWGQVIKRDSGEAQLEIVGKSSKARQLLIPAVIVAKLFCQPRLRRRRFCWCSSLTWCSNVSRSTAQLVVGGSPLRFGTSW
jgi:site-specific recombinase XerD